MAQKRHHIPTWGSVPLFAALLAAGSLIPPEPARALQPVQSMGGDRLIASGTSHDRFFNQAKAELPEDYYVLYRIIERLARANGLDQRPWRLRVFRKYEINAYASELNTLSFMAGLLDQIHGDTAALACVAGHEMAHHSHNHIPTRVAVLHQHKKIQDEAKQEAIAEIQNTQRQQAVTSSVGRMLGSVLGSVIGGRSGSTVGGTSQAVFSTMSAAQRQQAVARAGEIYKQKVTSLVSEYSELMHRHEFEADEYGFRYMVRAGFDPQGCIRVMDALDQLEHSGLPSMSHPNPDDRIQRLKALNSGATVSGLAQEGKANLRTSQQPLKYGLSRDKLSLRIESRFGSTGRHSFPQ